MVQVVQAVQIASDKLYLNGALSCHTKGTYISVNHQSSERNRQFTGKRGHDSSGSVPV